MMKLKDAEKFHITVPDDFHHHFRDGNALSQTVPMAARTFRRVIAMPNLKPPITTTAAALAYRGRILSHVPKEFDGFQPLMTLYLTDDTPPEEIRKAHETGFVKAVKLYPAGATTNSANGVTDFTKIGPTLKAMEEVGMLLLVHGEVTTPSVDIFDREAQFIETVLSPLVAAHPGLKVVVEHCTTRQSVEFVRKAGPNVAATITPQHLLYSRNALFEGGLRPHMYCLPVLKAEEHQRALVEAATSRTFNESKKFFLGTDSAPHTKDAKECACGSAGVFSAHAALELYTEIFEKSGASIEQLQAFASENGANFYGLPSNQGTTTLIRKNWAVPESYKFGDNVVVPLRAGKTIMWQIQCDS
eukprot:121878_1